MTTDSNSPESPKKPRGGFSFEAHSFKYWEIFLSWLFKYPSRCYRLVEDKEPRRLENPSDEFYQFGKTYRDHTAAKGIICRVTKSKTDIEKTEQILHLIYDHIQNPELCDFATAEVLAKVLAYRHLQEGDEVSIPILDADQNIHMSRFKVNKVFKLWNKIRSFGLVSEEHDWAAPILIFRGTDLSVISEEGRESIISDLDPKGPGRTLFEKAEHDLMDWLQSVTGAKPKARMVGHSLGGVIVAYMLLHQAPFISTCPHEISYAFNFPGVASDLVEKWGEFPSDTKPAYRGFVCRGDVISKFGQLFGNVFELSLERPLSPIRAHEVLHFAEPECYLHEVDLEEENRSSSREFYSKLQKQTSSMIYEFGLKFLFPR